MRRTSHKHFKKAGTGKLVTGLLPGSVAGTTPDWLTVLVTGAEVRRRLRSNKLSTRVKRSKPLEVTSRVKCVHWRQKQVIRGTYNKAHR